MSQQRRSSKPSWLFAYSLPDGFQFCRSGLAFVEPAGRRQRSLFGSCFLLLVCHPPRIVAKKGEKGKGSYQLSAVSNQVSALRSQFTRRSCLVSLSNHSEGGRSVIH